MRFLKTVIVLLIFIGCGSSKKMQGPKKNSALSNTDIKPELLQGLSDTTVTIETIALFNNLKNISERGFIFGQHSASYDHQTGVYPLDTEIHSDCYTAVGDHPGIFNFDFDRDSIDRFKIQVEEIFRRGGIISYSWHAKNPVTGGDCKDTTQHPVQSILANDIGWTNWKNQLDKIASYFNDLKAKGVNVPIIFRPFHEHTGKWFWWGKGHCTNEEYIALWKKTIDYLRAAGVNNMLIAYSPSRPSLDLEKTLASYPGDDYVDIIGFDAYETESETFIPILSQSVDFAVTLAKEKNKVAAITEFGVTGGLKNSDTNNWFMDTFLAPLKANENFKSIAFASTWFNARYQYWVPLPEQPNYESFVNFYKDDSTIFLNDMPSMYTLQ